MTALALLPLLLATPTIDGAKLELHEGNLRLEVATSEPVAREDIRTKLDGKALSVYIDGAEAARKSFGTAELGGNILPRANYAKIEIPLAAAMGCGGKAAVSVTDTGLQALLPCKPEAAAAAQIAEPVAAAPVKAVEPIKAEPAKVESAAQVEPAPKIEPAKAPEAATAETAKAPAPAAKAQPVKAEPIKPASTSTPAIAGGVAPSKGNHFSSLPTMVMVGLMLVGGYFLWRRKKHQRTSMIRILETASLGPKRALVIAEVNGERMILGTSEAGITMLTPMSMSAGGFPAETTGVAHRPAPSLAATLAAAATAPAATANSATMASDELPEEDIVPQPEGEGGLLAKLFKRRRAIEAADDDGPSTMADDFRDLLDDSLEDEELRRRLQAGLGGRTR